MSIESDFQTMTGRVPDACVKVPGRVNLIGEHTDYNGGMVLPTPVPQSVEIAAKFIDEPIIMIQSGGFDETVVRPLEWEGESDWSDYAAAAIDFARRKRMWPNSAKGIEILIESTIPVGSGLSSSSAVIVGMLKLLRSVVSSGGSDIELALWAQSVEHSYMKMPCGIMDQMAVSVAPPGKAMALNTATLGYSLYDLPNDPQFLVFHSGIYRRNNDGFYAERRAQCEEASDMLKVGQLCLMSDRHLSNARRLAAGKSEFKIPAMRAVHAAEEHRRVVDGVNKLANRDYQGFGELMVQSHASMRDLFDITTPELDQMVDTAVDLGAMGARMTGGGLGGCVVVLIENKKVLDWQKQMSAAFPQIRHIG